MQNRSKNNKSKYLFNQLMNQIKKYIMNNNQKQRKQKFQTLKEEYKTKFNKQQSSNLVQEMINETEQNEILVQEEDLHVNQILQLKIIWE
ncbi:unnamed protein product [Paramecium primaurelia]|uniref:Uncharacterized protein n=1 Tax=Paramecium primaurelia TaxID=5886 RepID=A0A8S1QIB1_PARPR|nr:unnamed protein product [Paramecium primaurelia]